MLIEVMDKNIKMRENKAEMTSLNLQVGGKAGELRDSLRSILILLQVTLSMGTVSLWEVFTWF